MNCSFKFIGVSRGSYKKKYTYFKVTYLRHNRLHLNPLSANFTKWSNTLKQFVGKFPTNCLSVFGHFVGLARKGLKLLISDIIEHMFQDTSCN